MPDSHPAHPAKLVAALAERAAGTRPGPAAMSRHIATENYTCPERFALERDRVFMRFPLIVCHESQLPEAGDSLVTDWLGLPTVTMRDREGRIGTFLNVCRHRGMRLVQDEGCTSLRSLVCPYHQWTYGLDGALRNIPVREGFETLDTEKLGLVALPTEVRHGLVWSQATPNEPMDLDGHLAGLGNDLDTFNMADFIFVAQGVKTISCNLKLVQDAFHTAHTSAAVDIRQPEFVGLIRISGGGCIRPVKPARASRASCNTHPGTFSTMRWRNSVPSGATAFRRRFQLPGASVGIVATNLCPSWEKLGTTSSLTCVARPSVAWVIRAGTGPISLSILKTS